MQNIYESTETLIQEALDNGFSQVGELKIEALVFMPEIREMCSVGRCNNYGKKLAVSSGLRKR
ncbi:hypothetical protein FACS18948_2370 [Clostridia bacterium]|nr:hypothetical protein FACS18948_2370 [Clostridia bacterium]